MPVRSLLSVSLLFDRVSVCGDLQMYVLVSVCDRVEILLLLYRNLLYAFDRGSFPKFLLHRSCTQDDAVSHAPQDLRRAQRWRTLSRRRRTS